MGSTVLNKAPSSFITFVYCFLLISFLFNIPLRTVAEGVQNGASSVHGSPLGHAPNAVKQGSPPKQSSPTQKKPESVVAKALNRGQPVVNCSRGNSYSECLPDRKSTERGVTPGGKH